MGKDQSLKTPFPLILASTSKYRGELLSQLGYSFTSEAPGVDEDKLKNQELSPKELSSELSRLKANAVFSKKTQACVIGSDQVCSLENHILSKPHTVQKAIEQLTLMQGKKHELYTAVTVMSPIGSHTFVNVTTLHMRKLSREEIEQYVQSDLPLDCAGSYKLESQGIKLFQKIEMEDHTAIIGLPLIELTSTLLKLGFSL